ncbi:MAG: TetR/AcrR family transcriptional regulator [Propionibacteriaceae bacterium]|nr:TetR/AcrR family transcriptional regulator [Propionibacteriaceae bacterium]
MDAPRERLLAEATRQFVERGYDGASMQQIADACGVTKAALYYHYAGKADLLLGIVGAYLDEVAAVVTRAGEASGAPAQLDAVVRGLFALPVESRAVMRLAMHDLRHLPEDCRAAFGVHYYERFLAPLTAVVAGGMDAGAFARRDPATVVWMLLGMLYPFFSGRPRDDEEQVVTDLLAVLLDGLAPRP